MGYQDTLVAFYKTDTGAGSLTVLLTGGIYSYSEIHRMGVSEDVQTGLYDANGHLKPVLFVKQRSNVPTNQLTDAHVQLESMRAVIEHYFYCDGDNATFKTALETAANRLYTLINRKKVAGVGQLRLINELDNLKAEEYDFANELRRDYKTISLKYG